MNLADLDHELLAVALNASTVASRILLDERPAELSTDTKTSSVDVVTEMDRRSERAIREYIAAHRPGDAVLGEEGGATAGSSGVTWIVDPLDGTVNYLYDLPQWAVSIAAEVAGVTRVGVVAVPRLDEVFWASIGQGAFCTKASRDHSLNVSAVSDLALSLVATGFAYTRGRRATQARGLVGVVPNVRDIRRAGAASVDLCHVAAGKVDAYFEKGLQPWDVAAGALIAREAGAIVVPDHSYAFDEVYVAAAPGIASDLLDLLAGAGAFDADLPDDFDARGLIDS